MSKIPLGVFDDKSFDRAVARLETPEIVKRIALGFAFGLLILSLLLAATIFALLPLKERVPYFLEAKPSGEVSASDRVAQRFEPTEKQMAYFLWHRFVMPVLTIDEQTRVRLKETTQVLRGAADGQLANYLTENKVFARIIEDPTLRQTVEPESRVDFFKTSQVSGTAVLWVVAKTVSAKTQAVTQRKRVTVDYVLLPVRDDRQMFSNPMGLYVTGFRIENVY